MKIAPQPKVITVERRIVKTIRTKMIRWYVVLDFGGKIERLAVSGAVAAWLHGEINAVPPDRSESGKSPDRPKAR